MKPEESWIRDWCCGLDPAPERDASERLLEVFKAFWAWADLDARSKTTRQRYSAALHSLGGYLTEEIQTANHAPCSAREVEEFIAGYIDAGDGPLIHHDNETWQKELDTVCRKLYTYLCRKT